MTLIGLPTITVILCYMALAIEGRKATLPVLMWVTYVTWEIGILEAIGKVVIGIIL